MKIVFTVLGIIIVPIFAEIYAYTSVFIIGGLTQMAFGKRISGIVSVLAVVLSIVCAIVSYLYLYRSFMGQNKTNDKKVS